MLKREIAAAATLLRQRAWLDRNEADHLQSRARELRTRADEADAAAERLLTATTKEDDHG